MPESYVFLPQPRELHWRAGSYSLRSERSMLVDRRAWERLRPALEEVQDEWRGQHFSVDVEPHTPHGEQAPLAITLGEYRDVVLDLPDAEEAYQIEVCPEGVTIAARTAHGLFNGLQTLRQLVAQAGSPLPCLFLRDWPALSLRGIHLDLKGAMASASYWQETIRLLAAFKINCVLIEYEDKFPFTSHPDVVGPGAFSASELSALLATAWDHFVEVIPLLQCLGHVEYTLRRPAYAELRESGDPTQFCPEHAGSLPVYNDLADEMIAAHPHCRSFHLGADEAWLLGDCPRCSAAVKERGRLGLFLGHVNRAIERVRDHGLRPIIWDDMIQRNLEANSLAALPQDVVLCDWFYSQRSTRAPSFYYGGGLGHSRYQWASRQWLESDPAALSGETHWLEEAPEAVRAFAREYWDRGEYPLYGSSLPWVRFFVQQGRAVIGASCAKGAEGFYAFSPLYERRIDNVAAWARVAKEDGAEGIISTAWSRYNGLTVPCEPFELGWPAYAASAAFYWEAREPDRRALDEQFAVCYLGAPGSAASKGLDWLDRGKQSYHAYLFDSALRAFEAEESGATAHGRRALRHLALAARLAQVQGQAERGMQSAWAVSVRAEAGLDPKPSRARHLQACAGALDGFVAWRQAAREVLATSLNAADVQEMIDTQCGGYERRLAHLREFLASVRPFEGDAR